MKAAATAFRSTLRPLSIRDYERMTPAQLQRREHVGEGSGACGERSNASGKPPEAMRPWAIKETSDESRNSQANARPSRFASRTKVPVEKTRLDIERLAKHYGAKGFASAGRRTLRAFSSSPAIDTFASPSSCRNRNRRRARSGGRFSYS